jgi:hypothetical protein
MRPLPRLAFLASHCLAAAAYATAMSVDPPSLAPERDARVLATAAAVQRGSGAEPPSVGFEATPAAAEVWPPAGREDPLPPASRLEVATETGASSPPACSDSFDNDGDGRSDFPDDPGCVTPGSVTERPRCQDGIDTDEDGHVDFDGGASLNGGVPFASPDPQCLGAPWRDRERP